MNRLIVIDGLDGSGKATQTALLAQALQAEGKTVCPITFPNYSSPSSSLVRLYLSGGISDTPQGVNAYAAASFYACDRYISYQTSWSRNYAAGELVLADRYVSSNAIHQMTKLPEQEWDGFLRWLTDYEYNRLGLPKENGLIYLDMHPKISAQLLQRRYHGDDSKKDIHERDAQYLAHCRIAALAAADKLGWQVIRCDDGLQPLPMDSIAQQVLAYTKEFLAL